MRDIRLPPELRVGEGYGKVSWAVRTLWETYVGWFKLQSTTELYPDSAPAALAELVDAAGIDATLDRAEAALARGDAVPRSVSERPSKVSIRATGACGRSWPVLTATCSTTAATSASGRTAGSAAAHPLDRRTRLRIRALPSIFPDRCQRSRLTLMRRRGPPSRLPLRFAAEAQPRGPRPGVVRGEAHAFVDTHPGCVARVDP